MAQTKLEEGNGTQNDFEKETFLVSKIQHDRGFDYN